MKREASQALNILLASVVAVPAGHETTGQVDTADPPYVGAASVETTIRADIAEQHDLGLTGTATSHEHWSRPAAVAELLPGPPTELALITQPGAVSDTERDLRVAGRMTSYRLTIVGGLAKETVYKQLEQSFGVVSTDVRWIETEKSREPPLNRLKGMQPESGHRVLRDWLDWPCGVTEGRRGIEDARRKMRLRREAVGDRREAT